MGSQLSTGVFAFLCLHRASILARKLGKKAAMVVGWFTVAVAGLLLKFFAYTGGNANVTLMIICMCLVQGAMSLYMSFQAVYWLDCGEYGYYKTGIDNRTMAVTVMNWPTKIGFMFGGSMVGWMIAWAGYQAPQAAGEVGKFASMEKFMTTMGLIPAILAAVAALGILFLYKLDDKTAAEYAKANVEREAAEKAKQA